MVVAVVVVVATVCNKRTVELLVETRGR